jgi:hypothetical protein
MSSVQCWKQPAFAVSTFSTNSTLYGENIHVKSGESGILSTISTMALALLSVCPQQFSLICCCATPCRSNYACLLRQIRLFGLFAAVVKSSVAQPYLLLITRHSLLVTFFVFTLYSALCTQHFFCRQPCGGRGGNPPQNTHSRHKIGRLFPCCRRVGHFCRRRRCRHNKKANPFPDSLLSLLCTLYAALSTTHSPASIYGRRAAVHRWP